ncbi:MAG: replication initiator [Phycicoccus sp.]
MSVATTTLPPAACPSAAVGGGSATVRDPSRHPLFPAVPDGVTTDLAVAAAEAVGVCVRPVLRTVTDRATTQVTVVPIPCGSTRSTRCPSCADRARRLRMHQCREGWHLTVDPLPAELLDDANTVDDAGDDPELEVGDDATGADTGRRVRSTRRRVAVPDLPTLPAEHRSTGRVYVDVKTGREYRPSMFITGTLPSYGLVRPGEGVPRHPGRYDYRRAALDALLFPRLVDRTFQNLRRCAGYKLQYFGTVEPQRRLAPHLHVAVRGTMPRAIVRRVFAASYVSIWWPPIDTVRYFEADPDSWPVWTADAGYVDPSTGEALPTWGQALDALDEAEDTEPLHSMGWGAQVDMQGILSGTEDSDRAVRYLTKYLTKAVADTYATDPDTLDPDDRYAVQRAARYDAHIDALHAHTRVLPCSPGCANWLAYGTQPKTPTAGMHPGGCLAKAHDRETLGIGGRRALVSRHWTGKTLTEHKADRAAVVREALAAAGIEAPETDRLAADTLHTDGRPRYVWNDTRPEQRDYPAIIAASLRQVRDWRIQYEIAKTTALQRGSPPTWAVDSRSASPREGRWSDE